MPDTRSPLLVTPRLLAGLAAGAAVATLAALFLGEYEFEGLMPYVAGPLLGLVIGEVLVSVGRQRHPVIAAIGAVYAAAALALAGFIDANGVEPVKVGAWIAAALAAAAAGARATRWR